MVSVNLYNLQLAGSLYFQVRLAQYSSKAAIIFKTIGTDSPQAYSLRNIYSPAPPFQCCIPIFILSQAATVSAYSTTTLVREGAGEGRNCERETGLSS